ncbi:MAG: acylneuraminate cytidylyltransferase family protein [Phycisphaerales bacterium]|nr:MAG: acylneuraminate cytidylyltransferase family protein [Phycisphaerales bacterium]
MNKATDNLPALAVIIGRAGSKGLPGKNALIVAGRPMVCHTIDHARASTHVGRIVVSTDGNEIAEAARQTNVPVIDRPAELAGDEVTVDAAVRHAVQAAGGDEPIIVILYANVPVRPADLIDRAIATLIETGADSVQSYCDVGKHHPAWTSTVNLSTSTVTPYDPTIAIPYRRQDLPPVYELDGGVIVVTRESLFTVIEGEPHAFLGKDRRGIVSPRGSVIDVDERVDLLVAEATLRLQRETASAAAAVAPAPDGEGG